MPHPQELIIGTINIINVNIDNKTNKSPFIIYYK